LVMILLFESEMASWGAVVVAVMASAVLHMERGEK